VASHTTDKTSKQKEPQRIGQMEEKLEMEHKDLVAEREKNQAPPICSY